jgi:NAD dependent epimerase/dehydratase family enzyme
VSWIHVDDLLNGIGHVLAVASFAGPVNLTAPQPVTNSEFAKTLGRVLGRPAIVAVPAFALRMVFGEEGADMLQTGQRVLPARLVSSGFRFQYGELETALRHLLAAPPGGS